jgi:hypothetical protein
MKLLISGFPLLRNNFQARYVGPQIGMNPKPILGLSDLELIWESPFGYGDCFFGVFFFSHAQDRPFLTKN